MKRFYPSCLVVLIVLMIMITGCGGSGSSNPPVPPAVSVTMTPQPPSSTDVGSTINLTAVVSNDSANSGVKWSVTCGSSQCGSFNPTTTPSGTATTYAGPTVPPTPATVTIAATSVSDTTKSASASITITAAPPVLADGNYVYHLAGEDGTSPYYLAGAFTVQNGVIAAGEQDMIDANNVLQDTLLASGSGLSLVNGNIQIVLNTGDTVVGVNGIETFRGLSSPVPAC